MAFGSTQEFFNKNNSSESGIASVFEAAVDEVESDLEMVREIGLQELLELVDLPNDYFTTYVSKKATVLISDFLELPSIDLYESFPNIVIDEDSKSGIMHFHIDKIGDSNKFTIENVEVGGMMVDLILPPIQMSKMGNGKSVVKAQLSPENIVELSDNTINILFKFLHMDAGNTVTHGSKLAIAELLKIGLSYLNVDDKVFVNNEENLRIKRFFESIKVSFKYEVQVGSSHFDEYHEKLMQRYANLYKEHSALMQNAGITNHEHLKTVLANRLSPLAKLLRKELQERES